jgi:hypothetical protein
MEGRVSWGEGGLDRLVDHVARWRDAGASHLSINTMGAGLRSPDEHIATLATVAGGLGLRSGS